MIVSVRSITPTTIDHEYSAFIVIGEYQHRFLFTAKPIPDEHETIVLINGDRLFNHTFKYSPDRRIDMYKLIRQLYDGDTLLFPMDLGEYGM